MKSPIAVFYEHPEWFKPLFAELERRDIPVLPLAADRLHYSAKKEDFPFGLLFNRASPSAYLRGRPQTSFATLDWLRAVERTGIPVVNGSEPYAFEISKARQLLLLDELGIAYPKSFVINHPEEALVCAERLRFPIVVKANIGGSGAGIIRYDSKKDLALAIEAGTVPMGLDYVALVQELCPMRDGHIVRMEVLGGEFLYAIKVHPEQGSFDLCPADACQTTGGQELVRSACALDAPKRGLKVEGFTPPEEMIEAAVTIARAIKLDVGGIEYLVDDRDGLPYVYDINALSNFVADAVNVVGFDPFKKLVDYLELRMNSRI